MKEIAKFLTDDSMIGFTDGTVVKGAEDVSNVIIRCCEEYNKGYLQGMTKTIGKGVLMVTVITGTVIVARKFIKSNRKRKKEA